MVNKLLQLLSENKEAMEYNNFKTYKASNIKDKSCNKVATRAFWEAGIPVHN